MNFDERNHLHRAIVKAIADHTIYPVDELRIWLMKGVPLDKLVDAVEQAPKDNWPLATYLDSWCDDGEDGEI